MSDEDDIWSVSSGSSPRQHTSESPRLGLIGLPDACILLILEYLSPKDIARGACACAALRDIFQADCVWERALPVFHDRILARACEPPRSLCRKHVFGLLCEQVFLQGSTQAFWLDAETGGACYRVSARGLEIGWGDDDRYWTWIPGYQGSRWPEVAYVKEVCWFQVTGELSCLLPPGTYTLAWRMQMASIHKRSGAGSGNQRTEDHVYGWATAPALFTLSLSNGSQASCSRRFLTNHPGNARQQNRLTDLTPVRAVGDDWLEYDVGEVLVESGQEGHVELIFSVTEVQSGHWKSGLNLDGVVVRPTYLTQRVGKYATVSELGKRWLKPGAIGTVVGGRPGAACGATWAKAVT